MQINISYDSTALIGAIGPSVWAKLGPENWFENYKIVVANSRDYDVPFVQNLDMKDDDLERFTTENIVHTPEFAKVANDDLPNYRFIVYKPINGVPDIDSSRFLANDISFSRFEDKKYFRDTFSKKIPIPKYGLIPIEDFLSESTSDSFSKLSDEYGLPFVVQDNLSGGGRGTFIIKSLADLEKSKVTISEEKKGTHVVISEFVRGIERSMQVFVSSGHTLRGPLQQQLVRNEDLLDPNGRGGMYFCGGRFLDSWSEDIEQQLTAIIQTVSATLLEAGYKGIFGLDFLLDSSGKIWVIEINARTTGLLPLLNEQQSEAPLYLLHILELAGLPYSLETATTNTVVNGPRSFVVLFNKNSSPSYFDETVSTGNFRFEGDKLVKIDSLARWNPAADCMIQLFASNDFPAKPNLKLANIFLNSNGFDDNGTLTMHAKEIVNYLKAHTIQRT